MRHILCVLFILIGCNTVTAGKTDTRVIIPYSIHQEALRADSLTANGQAEAALPIYKKVMERTDSLHKTLTDAKIKQIRNLYAIGLLELEKTKQQLYFRSTCISLICVALLILLYFVLRIYRNSRKLQKDEQETRRLVLIAQEANEQKGRFLTNISYNIRIPLNNVVGLSQVILDNTELSEEERKEYSAIIQDSSAELIELVNDILDLSRLEAGMTKFQMQAYDVQEWSRELLYMTQMHSEGHIHLQLQAETEDVRIHTDVNRFTQIVSRMLLYPNHCKEDREVKMSLIYQAKENKIVCRIENSPSVDPDFASQKVAIRQNISLLFFQHFKGDFEIDTTENSSKLPVIQFTYPTLTT